MAAPWLKYQQAAPASDGPWTKYAQAEAAPPALNGASDSGVQNFVAGVGKSLVDTGHGLVQAGTDAARYAVESNPALTGEQSIGDWLAGNHAAVRPDSLAGRLQSKVAQQQATETDRRRVDASLMDTGAGKAGVLVGSVAQALAVPESRIAGASRLASIGKAAATGGAYGALQPVAQGENRGHNLEVGAALGAGGQTVAGSLRNSAAKAAASIPDEVRQVWQKAQQLGIDLTPAQLSDSRIVKYMAHQFGMLPFAGGAATHEAQSGQFNRKLAEAIGVDAPRVTPEVYAAKKAADSAQFNDLTSRNNLTVTPDLARKLHSIASEAKIAGKDVHDAVNNAIDGLYSQMADGVVPGRAYQALDSILGRVSKTGDTAGHYVGLVKGAIRDAMDASIAPADKAAWNKLRAEYANRKTIRDLVAKADGGDLPPGLLKGRVTANNAGKERMATGTAGLMGELATIGSRMKAPPTSGSAERILVNDLVTPWKWPGLVAGATVGRAANSNRLAQMLMREGRGKTAQRLAVVARGAPALTPKKRSDDASDSP